MIQTQIMQAVRTAIDEHERELATLTRRIKTAQRRRRELAEHLRVLREAYEAAQK